jgi:hypothetical protein
MSLNLREEFIADLKYCIENNKTFAFYYQKNKKLVLNRFVPNNFRYIPIINNNNYIVINSKKYFVKNIIEFTDYDKESFWEKYSKCEGCRYGLNNQLGHMEYGGCMNQSCE